MTQFTIDRRHNRDHVGMWLHQNEAVCIDVAEGSLLDNEVYACKGGYAFFFEEYVGPNLSRHRVEFYRRDDKALDDAFARIERLKENEREERFFGICEGQGWSAYRVETNGDIAVYELEKCVNEHDVVQTIWVTHSFEDSLRDLYESYDPDYEAYIWLGDDGHGKNGAPYRMRDVLENMENVRQSIEDLYVEVRKAS